MLGILCVLLYVFFFIFYFFNAYHVFKYAIRYVNVCYLC